VVTGCGLSAVMLLPWAMLPDVVEFDELASGRRQEGLLYALFTFGQKLAGSVGVFANAIAAAVFGYVAGTAVQDAATVAGIRAMVRPVAAVVFAAALVLTLRFPRTRASHREVQAALEARRAEPVSRGRVPGAAAACPGAPHPGWPHPPARRPAVPRPTARPAAPRRHQYDGAMRELLYDAARHFRRGKALA